MKFATFIAVGSLLTLSGCATWSTSNVSNTRLDEADVIKTAPARIIISESDITDRPYVSLGDISVTVNKTTIFHADPTREMVNTKLQEQAGTLGADAVVLVRYGQGGVSLMSWGSLEGKGRAVQFTR